MKWIRESMTQIDLVDGEKKACLYRVQKLSVASLRRR